MRTDDLRGEPGTAGDATVRIARERDRDPADRDLRDLLLRAYVDGGFTAPEACRPDRRTPVTMRTGSRPAGARPAGAKISATQPSMAAAQRLSAQAGFEREPGRDFAEGGRSFLFHAADLGAGRPG